MSGLGVMAEELVTYTGLELASGLGLRLGLGLGLGLVGLGLGEGVASYDFTLHFLY